MSHQADLEQLLIVSKAQYDHQRQVFAKVVAEESQLRKELLRLKGLDQVADEDPVSVSSMRVIGADLLWHGWLSRSKSALNMQLARVLAIKAHEQDKVRKAFGKVVALQELIKSEKKSRHKRAAQVSLGLAIDQALR
jgi:hypothetical protein